MKIIEMNKDDKFDIDLSPVETQVNDQGLWDERERPSIDSINKFITTKHELKNQNMTIKTSNYFVEYKMLVKGKEHYSGIHTSQAELQTYTMDGVIHSYPTDFIRWIYLNKDKLELPDGKKNDTDYIATGVLLPIYRIFTLYDQYKIEKRLKELNMW